MTNNRGIALLIVLLIITLMGVMIFEFNYRTRVNVIQARNRADWVKALYIAKSGVNGMKEMLIEDSKESSYDGLDETWAQTLVFPLGAGTISIKVVDEGGKLNINTLINNDRDEDEEAGKRFSRLLDEIGMEPGLKDDVVRFLKEREDAPYKYKYKVDDLSELLDLDSLDSDDLKVLDRVITTNSNPNGKVNINTAPREVIVSLSDSLTSAMVDEIINYREEEPFDDVDKVKDVARIDNDIFTSSIRPIVDIKSDYFTIYSQAQVNGVRKSIITTISRENRKIKVLKWKER